jgi:hypothetical protein
MKKTAIFMSLLTVISMSGQMKKDLADRQNSNHWTKSKTLLAEAGIGKKIYDKTRDMDFGCVTLTEPGFQAVKNGAEIDFSWISLTEYNCGEYAIQKSSDGQNYETIEMMKAAGTRGQMTEYGGTEFTPETGTALYRLMIVATDGQIRFSSPVSVTVSEEDIQNEGRDYDRKDSLIAQKYGIGDSQVLMVLRDSQGNEQYSKFMMLVQDKKLIAVDIENRVSPGKYMIVATSNNRIYGKKVRVK